MNLPLNPDTFLYTLRRVDATRRSKFEFVCCILFNLFHSVCYGDIQTFFYIIFYVFANHQHIV